MTDCVFKKNWFISSRLLIRSLKKFIKSHTPPAIAELSVGRVAWAPTSPLSVPGACVPRLAEFPEDAEIQCGMG